ncbi:MAG: 2-oxoacid:acceptor oxidoreductase subunit alpha [Candidatus Kerfeldbacteria bacterium]|nr:2-oxoacid:acceptor oxidoreductase subunit alpha [Candidatus Kerfeldbacteria bacterium]
MKINNLNWKIGGEAGYGIASAGEIFGYACAHGGLESFAYLEYPSLIRGGHNTYQVWVRQDNVQSHSSQIDLLIALNLETADRHLAEVIPGGGLIFDLDYKDLRTYSCQRGDISVFPVPLETLAKQAGGEKVMRNTVAVAASLALVQFPFDYLSELIARAFKKKGETIIKLNVAAARAGYDYVAEKFQDKFNYKLEVHPQDSRRLLVNGNEAIAIGAIKAGVKFCAAYPMTPASSIFNYLANSERKYNLVVKQTEDEIAAMNMVAAAGFAGVRAMTATSGGGFSLMVEALGLAGMVESPAVIVLAQRPGPATGLPTWTEQGDLRFVLHAAQGDFPRVILAPGDPAECFELAFQAFNLAEKYQLPVIILTDKYLAEARQTLPFFKTDNLKIDRGEWADVTGRQPNERFERYADTKTGVSPRVIPGTPGGVFVANSDEHEPSGLSNEESAMRKLMMDKRMRKLQFARADVPEPVKLYGPKEADVTIVGWGSMKGPILEAMKMLESKSLPAGEAGKSLSVNFLQIRLLEPFPIKEVDAALRQAKHRLLIENNYSGQLGGLIRERTGIDITDKLLKYDGRPIHPEEIVSAINTGSV